MVAFVTFDALAFGVTVVRKLAGARWSAADFQAFLGDLRNSADHERQWSAAASYAIHLSAAWAENFAITGAFTLRLHGRFEQGNVDWSA